jgi:hypothetical protein
MGQLGIISVKRPPAFLLSPLGQVWCVWFALERPLAEATERLRKLRNPDRRWLITVHAISCENQISFPQPSSRASMTKIYDAEMQYLSVAIAKDVGLDTRGGVVPFESDRISRECAGLKALLVYSIVAPCYSVMARMLVDASEPIPISQFLSQAWSSKRGLGMPQRLEMEAALLSGDRGFVEWAQLHGIACSPAVSAKAHSAFARSAQDLRWSINWPSFDTDGKPAPALAATNHSLFDHDTFVMAISSGYRKSMDHLTFSAWITRGQTFCNETFKRDDWNPACLVEKPKSIPKTQVAALRSDESEPFYVHGLKELVAMWPGGRRAFFRGMHLTARDFDHWVSGRAHLTRQTQSEVMAKAGVIYDRQCDAYILGGGNLLQARTAKDAECVYIELSHGGDLEYAFEALSPPGKELPVRVLVFAAWMGPANLIFLPRDGGRAESLMDDPTLINLTPARKAPGEVWDTLSWIFEHREMFDNPKVVGMEFGLRHRHWLTG